MVTLISVGALRGRLSWLVAGWIVIQTTMLFASPVAIYASASAQDSDCACPNASPGAQCPMHKHGGSHHESSEQSPRCAMRSALPDVSALMISAVATGVVPQSRFVSDIQFEFTDLHIRSSSISSRIDLPEAPPPRA